MEPMSSDPVLAQARVDFLLRHSGKGVKQCRKHPPLRDMPFPAVLEALREETGLGISRYWYAQLCDRLGIDRSHRKSRPARQTLEEKRAHQRAWYKAWFERVKADPERYAKLQERAKARWQATIRSRQ